MAGQQVHNTATIIFQKHNHCHQPQFYIIIVNQSTTTIIIFQYNHHHCQCQHLQITTIQQQKNIFATSYGARPPRLVTSACLGVLVGSGEWVECKPHERLLRPMIKVFKFGHHEKNKFENMMW